MYLIDASYFTREYNIPNAQELISNTGEILEKYVDNKVRQFLRDLLGYELFTELDSHVTNGVLSPTAPQKWKDLVNGKEDWKGILFQDGVYKVSLLTPFVYYYWLYDNTSQVTATGEKVSSAVNAQNHSSLTRLVKTWNEFVMMYSGKERNFFKGYVNGVFFADYYGQGEGYKSLVQYLRENKDDFPTAVIPHYEFKNTLGL